MTAGGLANVTLVGNRFESNRKGVGVAGSGSAVGNGWGHPHGPTVGGAVAGDKFVRLSGPFPYEPWLTAPPARARSCPT